jgi:hypothetical protein
MERIDAMLAETGQPPWAGRVVLDVGCNAGMMLAGTLSEGAAWGLGWDMPHVAARARQLLLTLGYTRFDVTGGELSRETRLVDAIPDHLTGRLDGSVVLYLAIRHHVGFVRGLAEVPWSTLIYEGGEEESVATLPEHLAELDELCDYSVAAAIDFRDSETGSRPLAVLVRH